MKRRVNGVTAAVAACLALGALTGVAFAGNPNGTPPGQAKQDASSQPQTPTTSDNSTGVKPSNTTQHNTSAPASSNKTKLYGNGKTAGQIATKAGYGNATLHGPGNSQPHKVAPCPGGHEVDVHALKAHAKKGCAQTQASTSAQTQASTSASSAGVAAAAAPSKPSAATAPASGVLGGRAALTKPAAKSAPHGGVLGATARTGGALPFTGVPLWIPALAALGLLAAGLGLRRQAGFRA